MSAIPSTRGLGALPPGLLSPTGPTETPPVVDHTAATEQAEQPRRQTRRRRVTGEKVLKVTLPAALAERVQLAAIPPWSPSCWTAICRNWPSASRGRGGVAHAAGQLRADQPFRVCVS
jgi:hypothetical protein